jgi:macrolide-specific efflux system membrane fusion protein
MLVNTTPASLFFSKKGVKYSLVKEKDKLMKTKSAIKKIFARRITRIILFIIVLISAYLLISNYIQNKRKEQTAEKFAVQKGTVSEDLILSGKIKAEEDAKLFFPTSGKLVWIGVKEGDYVKKGQALASLDKTPLNAAYQQALNNIRMYEANVEATYDSLQGKDTSETFAQKATRTASEVAKDNAYDALKVAEYNLKNATLIAPFSGFVTYSANPFAGVNVISTQMQIEIVNPQTMYFEVTASQDEITNLKKDAEVKITLDSFPEKEIKGKITFISLTPITQEEGADYKVKVSFTNLNQEDLEKLKIGMTGDIRYSLKSKDNVLYAPSQFIKTDRKGKYVNLGSIKNKVYVKTGIENDDSIEIIEGVKEGDILYD